MKSQEIEKTIKKVLLEMGNPIEKINSTSLSHINYSYDMVVRFMQSLSPNQEVVSDDEIEGLLMATEQLIEVLGGMASLDLGNIENIRRRANGHLVITDPFSL